MCPDFWHLSPTKSQPTHTSQEYTAQQYFRSFLEVGRNYRKLVYS